MTTSHAHGLMHSQLYMQLLPLPKGRYRAPSLLPSFSTKSTTTLGASRILALQDDNRKSTFWVGWHYWKWRKLPLEHVGTSWQKSVRTLRSKLEKSAALGWRVQSGDRVYPSKDWSTALIKIPAGPVRQLSRSSVWTVCVRITFRFP